MGKLGRGNPQMDALTLQEVLELLPAALYICEAPSGRITFYNANASKLWGRTPKLDDTDERFCGSFKLWQTDGSPLPHDRTPMARAVHEGIPARNEEVIIERPDGTRVAVVVNIDPILDADGRIVGAVNVFHDTAVLKHAVEARAQLAAIIESSQDAIISKDLDGTIMSWNAGAERLFGYSALEAIGQPVTMLIPPDRRDDEPGILAKVRRGERVEHYETVRRDKNGNLIEISLSVSPILDDRGAVIGASKIARDITEQKLALRRIAWEQEATSRLYEIGRRSARSDVELKDVMTEVLDAAIWITKADKGNVQIYDEESRTLKILVHRGFESTFLEFFASVDADESSACGVALAEGQRQTVEDVLQSPVFGGQPSLQVLLDADVRAVQSTPLISSRGAVSGMVSTHFGGAHLPSDRECRLLDLLARQAADYLERMRGEEQREQLLRLAQQAREQAEAASRAKDEFLAMLGHELRNPLSAVRNAIAVAALDEKQRSRALDIARRQSDQLVRLVDDLLDVARITRGKVALRTTRIALSDFLPRAVDGARAHMQELGHTLTLSLPADEIELDGDPARLEQVIVNLLSNAAKYTDPGGTIEVLAERSDARVTIRIRDNGIGIAPELLPRVFDLFSQGTRALDRAQGGLGIGLTLVRRIVELHGGTIEAESAGPDMGTEMIIQLPAVSASSTFSREEPPDPPTAGDTGRPARVLIVEDNPDAADTLQMLLELLGHHVRAAPDAPTALIAARANVPDLMLIDIGLPGMDGYDLARAIRRDASVKHVVLVALTGYGQQEDKAKAMAAGFDYHLAKPVATETLGELVARLGGAKQDPSTRKAVH